MYYNTTNEKIVIDSVDIFLISSFTASPTARYLKEYSSEEAKVKREKAKMDRLKANMIKKSIKMKYALKDKCYSEKIYKIYRVALNPRVGQIEDILIQAQLESEFSLEFTIAERIEQAFIKTKENNADKLRFIFITTRLGLNLILVRCNIRVEYFFSGWSY